MSTPAQEEKALPPVRPFDTERFMGVFEQRNANVGGPAHLMDKIRSGINRVVDLFPNDKEKMGGGYRTADINAARQVLDPRVLVLDVPTQDLFNNALSNNLIDASGLPTEYVATIQKVLPSFGNGGGGFDWDGQTGEISKFWPFADGLLSWDRLIDAGFVAPTTQNGNDVVQRLIAAESGPLVHLAFDLVPDEEGHIQYNGYFFNEGPLEDPIDYGYGIMDALEIPVTEDPAERAVLEWFMQNSDGYYPSFDWETGQVERLSFGVAITPDRFAEMPPEIAKYFFELHGIVPSADPEEMQRQMAEKGMPTITQLAIDTKGKTRIKMEATPDIQYIMAFHKMSELAKGSRLGQ